MMIKDNLTWFIWITVAGDEVVGVHGVHRTIAKRFVRLNIISNTQNYKCHENRMRSQELFYSLDYIFHHKRQKGG